MEHGAPPYTTPYTTGPRVVKLRNDSRVITEPFKKAPLDIVARGPRLGHACSKPVVTNLLGLKSQRHVLCIWNQAPHAIKDCISLYSAKKAIKTFVSSLPI